MAEYIERDAVIDLITRRYENPEICTQEINGIPAADVAPVVHGKPDRKIRTVMLTGYHEEIGVFAKDGSNLYRKKMTQADIPYDHCPACGAVLCSRWHNFCGRCGAKMDVEDGGDSDAKSV